MALGKKTGGRNFQKGKPGGPGRPPLPADVKEAKRLNKASMEAALNKFLTWDLQDLVSFVKDPKNPALEMIIARILVESFKRGDNARLGFVFDRLVGKVTEKVEHGFPKPTVIKLFGEEAVVVLGSELKKDGEE